jgi:hypothetical protein
MPFDELPVCVVHAFVISHRVHTAWERYSDSVDMQTDSPVLPSFVYYLMVGPSTVKIGTTTNLKLRLNALRADLQYVVAS